MDNPIVNSQRYLMLTLVLSLTASKGESPASSSSEAASAMPADQVASPASATAASVRCRAADLDKRTPTAGSSRSTRPTGRLSRMAASGSISVN